MRVESPSGTDSTNTVCSQGSLDMAYLRPWSWAKVQPESPTGPM